MQSRAYSGPHLFLPKGNATMPCAHNGAGIGSRIRNIKQGGLGGSKDYGSKLCCCPTLPPLETSEGM